MSFLKLLTGLAVLNFIGSFYILYEIAVGFANLGHNPFKIIGLERFFLLIGFGQFLFLNAMTLFEAFNLRSS